MKVVRKMELLTLVSILLLGRYSCFKNDFYVIQLTSLVKNLDTYLQTFIVTHQVNHTHFPN